MLIIDDPQLKKLMFQNLRQAIALTFFCACIFANAAYQASQLTTDRYYKSSRHYAHRPTAVGQIHHPRIPVHTRSYIHEDAHTWYFPNSNVIAEFRERNSMEDHATMALQLAHNDATGAPIRGNLIKKFAMELGENGVLHIRIHQTSDTSFTVLIRQLGDCDDAQEAFSSDYYPGDFVQTRVFAAEDRDEMNMKRFLVGYISTRFSLYSLAKKIQELGLPVNSDITIIGNEGMHCSKVMQYVIALLSIEISRVTGSKNVYPYILTGKKYRGTGYLFSLPEPANRRTVNKKWFLDHLIFDVRMFNRCMTDYNSIKLRDLSDCRRPNSPNFRHVDQANYIQFYEIMLSKEPRICGLDTIRDDDNENILFAKRIAIYDLQ